MSTPPASGRMSWTEAVAGPRGAWLQHDLDSPHVSEARETQPPSYILRASRVGSWRIRAPLDGDTALLAVHDGERLVRTVPRGADNGAAPISFLRPV